MYVDEERGVVLAHRRLAVVDLSENARQPMESRSGRRVVVFNGEIYNFRKLMTEDDAAIEDGDTRRMLESLDRVGADGFDDLDGMYSLALWDRDEHSLTLAVDHFGEKPLYWLQCDSGLFFASELRALRTASAPWARLEPCVDAFAIYLSIGSFPAPLSPWQNVCAAEPGRRTVFHGPGGHPEILTVERRLPPDRPSGLRRALGRAVVSRSYADVPVGLFLSAGVDSSALLLAAQDTGVSLREALVVDLKGAGGSEASDAARFARAAGLDVAVVETDRWGVDDELLEGFFSAMDRPTSDGLNVFIVAGAAAGRGIKVWLSGLGGDEAFGGYPAFSRCGMILRARAAASRWFRSAPAVTSGFSRGRWRLERWRDVCTEQDAILGAYLWFRRRLPTAWVSTLLDKNQEHIRDVVNRVYRSRAKAERDWYQCVRSWETRVYMGGQLLRDCDNFSMCHGVEVRAPFLAPMVFDQAWGSQGPQRKSDICRAFPEMVDGGPCQRRKRGFSIPVASWFEERVDAWVERGPDSRAVGRLIDPVAIRGLHRGVQRRGVPFAVLWPIFVADQWWARIEANEPQ